MGYKCVFEENIDWPAIPCVSTEAQKGLSAKRKESRITDQGIKESRNLSTIVSPKKNPKNKSNR
jgi:hypothetical protein